MDLTDVRFPVKMFPRSYDAQHESCSTFWTNGAGRIANRTTSTQVGNTCVAQLDLANTLCGGDPEAVMIDGA